MRRLFKELNKEKELLNRLVAQELSMNCSRTLSDTILAQSQKVDGLIFMIEKEELSRIEKRKQ